ncbi:tetratricopeptide repeat protein [Thalassotalea sp. LPB0316]|uniref:tetratricopeptide repeat protein n=1 Tax=Thalassotalea sp. LPB0316 TaxID=2769490 RepID=UPI0018675ABD|nr:tetratricopeptide repeat protein [Thalassotalea sp. LPB0316]QOL26745.1 tetratricopeptide repeat protein [Thalassotalea sp. LPB0316]
MSVINQMLKDLDERKPEQLSPAQGHQVPITPAKKPVSLVFVVITLLLLNAVGWFIYQLYQENKALKANASEQQQVLANRAEQPQPRSHSSTSNAHNSQTIVEPNSQQEVNSESHITIAEQPKTIKAAHLANQKNAPEQIATPQVNAAASEPAVQQAQLPEETLPEREYQPAIVKQAEPSQPPSLTVARKKLTSEQLLERKLAQAEKAIANNELAKAEGFYEEALILDQDQAEVRKQLAALWYGRKAYQAALNLLHQGSAIDYNNSEFRLMKARIYLTMGQASNALSELLTLKDVNSVEYQAMIASTAQELQQYQQAIEAYQQLTRLQPHDGRWWLGLAIAYDTNATFDLAKDAYKNAISLSGISDSSMAFARQRLQELGE